MQENRSFDSYFGTYPGANGIPAGVCVPDPLHGGCVAPFHDPNNENYGGPHGHGAVRADLDGGKMDGFVGEAEKGTEMHEHRTRLQPLHRSRARARQCIDPMGYHDAREIPNYWTYAQNFVLQDDMFEPDSSWSWPEHLYLVSGWSATCPKLERTRCRASPALEGPPIPEAKDGKPNPYTGTEAISLPWTDVTYLLHKHSVSWRYYIFEGDEPDCEDDEAMTCAPVKQGPKTPGIWNPLVDFIDVKEDGQLGNVQSLTNFYTAVQNTSECGLPNVSWIIPNSKVSEHPPALISTGQAYVTTLINSIMRSPCWDSTRDLPLVGRLGRVLRPRRPAGDRQRGLRLPRPRPGHQPVRAAGYIDHQQLSHDAYLKFIEDDFLEGQRLNPKTDGRPDSRTDVREEAPGLGNLVKRLRLQPAPAPAAAPARRTRAGTGLLPARLGAAGATAAGIAALRPGPHAPAPAPTPPPLAPGAPALPDPAAHGLGRAAPGPAPESRPHLSDGRLQHGLLALRARAPEPDAAAVAICELRSVRTSLAAHRTVGITLSLSHRNLSAVRSALRSTSRSRRRSR